MWFSSTPAERARKWEGDGEAGRGRKEEKLPFLALHVCDIFWRYRHSVLAKHQYECLQVVFRSISADNRASADKISEMKIQVIQRLWQTLYLGWYHYIVRHTIKTKITIFSMTSFGVYPFRWCGFCPFVWVWMSGISFVQTHFKCNISF